MSLQSPEHLVPPGEGQENCLYGRVPGKCKKCHAQEREGELVRLTSFPFCCGISVLYEIYAFAENVSYSAYDTEPQSESWSRWLGLACLSPVKLSEPL